MTHFSPFRLDSTTGLLYRGRERVPLSRKSVAVLGHLVAKAGSVVSKQELLAAVWPDTHVVEANLKVHVLEIRRALHDDVRRPLFIETLHGCGYRFIAPVTVEDRNLPRVAAPALFAVPVAGR